MIEIWTEELPSGWEWDPGQYVGGTTEFYVNTAESANDDVLVYYDGPSRVLNGVYYLPRSKFVGREVVLSCNSIAPKKGKYNIYWTSWFKQRQEAVLDFDERVVLSRYHQSIFGYDSRIVPLSCNPDLFKNPHKIKGKCLFSSSPDRGLGFLESIWPEVQEATGAQLVSTYDKSITEEEMIEHYKSSEFWLHPGIGIELFCISAAKAQTAKCIPVVVPEMALAETVQYGVKVTIENYKTALIEAIKSPPKIKKVDFGSWQSVTKNLFKNVKF